MIQPKIQTVYTEIDIFSKTQMEDCVDLELSGYFKEESLVTFTPQEFEDYKREFGKELLNEVSKNCSCWIYNEANGEEETYPIDLEEILPALDDYLKENKI